MKKIFLTLLLVLFAFSYTVYAQELTNDEATSDYQGELSKMKNELNSLKKDIEMLKKRTEWFSFNVEGSVKIIWGVNIWARKAYEDLRRNEQSPYFNTMTPITHGFDFENKIRFNMNLGNKVIASSSSSGNFGTEISLELMIKSVAISDMKPKGSYYIVDALDDQGNAVDIYFPRYEAGGSNVLFGNFEIVLKEAMVKNIIGSGFFVNYMDVMEVQNYYGVESLVDILSLNDKYFNNGFIEDANEDFGSLYYSFDTDDYEDYDLDSQASEAVKLWSNSMLHTDPNDSDYNQEPHGFSLGYNKRLADGFNLYAELGVSSKDSFDPEYFEDNNIDYGFFIKAEPKFFSDKFVFHPKLALGFAFQTDTTEDVTTQFSTFSTGLSLPFDIALPSGKKDKIKFAFNWNLNVNVGTQKLATMISFFPELVLLNDKLSFSIPLIYSFKNSDKGGFLRVGNQYVQWIDQLYENHILHLGFLMGFDSKKLFGDVFQYKITSHLYFAYLQQWDSTLSFYQNKAYYPLGEMFLFEVIYNEFALNDLGPEKIGMFLEFGVGYASNARYVDSTTSLKYQYDSGSDSWSDTNYGADMEWKRWPSATVLSFNTGFYIDIIKQFSIGLSADSPKILIGAINPLGNQGSYALFKLWSEIRF